MSDRPSPSVPTHPVRVIVVDDHPAVCEALAFAIERAPGLFMAGAAHTADEAVRLVRDADPDVAVVDISLGDSHGLDLMQTLQAERPPLRAVVLSMYADDVYAERSLRSGALGYVNKSEPTSTLVEAVRAAANGKVHLAPGATNRILTRMTRLGTDTATVSRDLSDLTDREMTVFQLLGDGHSCDSIADELQLARKTVETYRRRAREKLGLDTTSELLRFAIHWAYAQGRPATGSAEVDVRPPPRRSSADGLAHEATVSGTAQG